jgi:hypothetical protein
MRRPHRNTGGRPALLGMLLITLLGCLTTDAQA